MKKINKINRLLSSTAVVVVLGLPVGVLMLPRVAQAHSETQSPGTCATVNIGNPNWSNPTRAVSSNNSVATATVGDNQATDRLQCSSYGFTIPAGATILGIIVNVERRTNDVSAISPTQDSQVRLIKGGVVQGTDRSTATAYTLADVIEAHGTAADLWGTTWTPAEINAADFGAAFVAFKNGTVGGNVTISVDHVEIVVHYSEPPPPPTLVSPADGAVLTTGTPVFDWTDVVDPDGDTLTYEIQADNSGCGFASAEVNQTGLALSTFTPGSALADGTYCWRARAVDQHTVAGAYSATRNVTINTVSAFDAVAVAAALNTAITTKIAGSTFSLDVLALKAGAVHTGYRGTVTVEIVNAATGGGVCSAMTSLQNLGSFVFAAGDNGRKTVSAFNYANATANARIRIIDSSVSVTSCSFDNFAIRPNSFANLSVTDTDWQTAGTVRTLNSAAFGAIVHKAGRSFTVRADAHNSLSAVTNAYAGSPTATLTACGPGVGFEACTAAFGAMSITSAFAAGQLNSSATYSEVGAFNLQLQDTTFAAVDAADTAANCTATGRYVCSAVTAVGRFVPDHFIVTPGALTNRQTLSCAPASTFTYEGEQMRATFTLTARNGLGVPTTTANYTTASGIARLDGTVFANFGFGAVDLADATPPAGATALTARVASGTSSGTWVAGVGSFTVDLALSRAAAPDGPFESFQLGIIPADADNVTLRTADLNLDTDVPANVSDRVLLGSSKVRYGQLRLGGASGSPLLPLRLPLEAKYWNSTVFITNVNDSCTTLTTANVGLGNYVRTASGTTTVSAVTSPLASGRGTITLAAPAADVRSVDVAVNLGPVPPGTGTADACASFAPTATAANKSYLRGNWCNPPGTYSKDPAARARFGILRSSDEAIYTRENTN